MVEPRFADDDDLPRTFRREREARQREMREREMAQSVETGGPGVAQAYTGPAASYGHDYAPAGDGGTTVTRLKIPFVHLMLFFMKAVIAAIPALILLTVVLWGLGQVLKAFLPWLRHFEIIVRTAG
jgi:hypothetical protein